MTHTLMIKSIDTYTVTFSDDCSFYKSWFPGAMVGQIWEITTNARDEIVSARLMS